MLQLWVKAIASLSVCLFQRPMEHLTYNPLHQRYTHWLQLLCVLSLPAENYRHIEMATYFQEHCVHWYLQRIIHTESKRPLCRRHSTIPFHTGHGPLVRTSCHEYSPLHSLPYSEGRKHRVKPRSLGELRSAELRICTSAPRVRTRATSL